MEPVKDMGELLGGDGLALVADGDIGFAGLGGNPESETPLGRGELHGVVQQVVADLGDCVWVCPKPSQGRRGAGSARPDPFP